MSGSSTPSDEGRGDVGRERTPGPAGTAAPTEHERAFLDAVAVATTLAGSRLAQLEDRLPDVDELTADGRGDRDVAGSLVGLGVDAAAWMGDVETAIAELAGRAVPERLREHRTAALDALSRVADVLADAAWCFGVPREDGACEQLRRGLAALRALQADPGAPPLPGLTVAGTERPPDRA